jgi:predicted GNAT family acetyltransferase
MNLEVKIDKDKNKFFTFVEGHEVYLDFTIEGNVIDFQHTYTPRELRGKGLAAIVVRFAFEYAKENNLKVIPSCPYIHTFLEKNEQYKELLA